MKNNKAFLLSDHLKGFSAVNLDGAMTAATLKATLTRYGPVQQTGLDSFNEAIKYLLPIKSFTTRFVILGKNDWSFILCDMRDQCCYVDAYAVSRAHKCKAMGVVLQPPQRREIHVFDGGEKVRQIESLLDGDRWYFREDGMIQSFEEPAEYKRKSKNTWLSPETVNRYFERYTGLKVPEWKNFASSEIIGLERSLRDLRVKVVYFPTLVDL